MQSFPLREIQQALLTGRNPGFELGGRAGKLYLEYEADPLDVARLERALDQLIRRHEMLRAVVTADGRLRILERPPRYTIPVRDLRELEGAELAAGRGSIREDLCRAVGSPESWPLFALELTLLPRDRILIHLSFDLLVVDGPSSDIFSRELMMLYDDPEVELPPLNFGFRQYGEREFSHVGADVAAQARRYWSSYVETLPPAPALPCRTVSAADADCSAITAGVAAQDWGRLKSAALRRGLLPSSLLLALYAEVVGAYSEHRRFALNLPLASRLPIHDDVNNIIGVFTSPVLFGVDVSRRESVADRARRLQKELAAHWREGRIAPMHGLREYVRRRGSGARAVAPVVFTAMAPAPSGEPAARRLGEIAHWWVQTPQVRLESQLRDGSDGRLYISWNFAAETFAPGVAESMLECFLDSLRRLIADDESWTRSPLSVVAAADLAIQADANDTAAELEDVALHAGVLRSIAAHPDRTAVIDGRRALTYRELGRSSRELGRRLERHGARADDLVAVVMSKGWRQVAAAIGVLRSGAAYVPLDAGLPRARVHELVRDSRAIAVVTTPELERELAWPEHVARFLVDDAMPAGDDLDGDDLDEASVREARSTGDAAYVIYTSGSTGKPKGVVIEHRAAVNTLGDVTRRFGVTGRDRALALSSMSFDLSVHDVFGVLGAGGTLVIPDGERLRDPAYLAELVKRHGITLWNSVPALMQMVAEWVAGSERAAGALESLRLILLSGDWLPLNLPPLLRSTSPGATLVNLGGATEAAVWSIFHVVEHLDPERQSVPYGRPLANQSFHVLDEGLQPRPIGVPGHLYIGGRGLAREYLGDPVTTSARFIRHPTSGERLYRTGDLGRYHADGSIEFLGREDFQVKIHGYRVELGEIEAILLQHEQVRACAVNAADGPGGKALAAYLVAEGSPSAASSTQLVDDVQAFARARLPSYMCPHFVVLLDSLPVSENGKVDRARLPDPRSSGRDRSGAIAPRNQAEAKIQAIWQEVLGCEAGVSDSFFDLGGTSFAASRMLLQVERAFQRHLGIAVLLRAPTIEGLARALLDRSPAGGSEAMLVPLGGPPHDQPHLYLMHPTGGNVLCYGELARRMRSRALAAFQSRGLVGGNQPEASLEGMAASYADAIQAQGAAEPICLAGWSMGGVIAFEVARQLRTRGVEVGMLALVDSVAPDLGRPYISGEEAALLGAFARDLGVGEDVAVEAERRARRSGTENALSSLFQASRDHDAGESSMDGIHLLWRVFRANLLALRDYRPEAPYPGPAMLIRAADGFARGLDAPALGWAPLIEAALDIHEVPGDHYSALRVRGGQAIADLLEAGLQAATA